MDMAKSQRVVTVEQTKNQACPVSAQASNHTQFYLIALSKGFDVDCFFQMQLIQVA
jgi:hypothetical protein